MRKFAVTGIGHAVMDIQASVQDIALIALGYPKGQRHLLTLDQLMALENTIFSPIPNDSGFLRESRGGSIANSLGVMAALGSSTALCTTVGHDGRSDKFLAALKREHIKAYGGREGGLMGLSLIAVSPEDGERTMLTFPGANEDLAPRHINPTAVASSQVVFMEGYLFDHPKSTQAFQEVMRTARLSQTLIAFSLSSVRSVQEHPALMAQATASADLIFANTHEANAFGTRAVFEKLAQRGKIIVITHGKGGAEILHRNKSIRVLAKPAKVVDTTGAGDAFAGGFLHSYTRGGSLQEAGEVAALCAAHVVGRPSAVPSRNLAYLVRRQLQKQHAP